jgi:geranylgeranyl diphosphate synthase type II
MIAQHELQRLINDKIARLPLNAQPHELYEPIRYFMSLGGKRMRPMLVLMGCELFGGKVQDALEPAIGVELFHNFTLLHDDIMDNSPLRRSHPTVHEKWSVNVAILSGDAMFVKACELMMNSPKEVVHKVMSVFLDNALKVCEGQQFDMNYEKAAHIALPSYIRMIELKTAVLLGASLEIGALLGGASEADAELLYEFGRKIGIAFQLQDDILDVYGDEQKFGKQKGRDIVSNKKTFLMIKALEMANSYTQEELRNWLQATNFVEQEKVKAVTAIYNFLGVRDLARKEMMEHYNKGMQALEQIEVSEQRKKDLIAFADSLMVREN